MATTGISTAAGEGRAASPTSTPRLPAAAPHGGGEGEEEEDTGAKVFEFLADLATFSHVFADLTTTGAYLHI